MFLNTLQSTRKWLWKSWEYNLLLYLVIKYHAEAREEKLFEHKIAVVISRSGWSWEEKSLQNSFTELEHERVPKLLLNFYNIRALDFCILYTNLNFKSDGDLQESFFYAHH